MHGTSVISLFQALSQATTRLISTVRTAKELDEETGLYYYGARYLDPKYSMWISTDPAFGEYIPKAPIDEEAKKYNQNLPGMGGVFNHINSNLYHYAGNNPVRYIDPDGNIILPITSHQYQNSDTNKNAYIGQYPTYDGYNENTLGNYGCLFTAFVNIGNSYNQSNNTANFPEQSAATLASKDEYFNFESISRKFGAPTNFNSSTDKLSALLTDMTGQNFNVERYNGSDSRMLVNFAKYDSKEVYLVAEVRTKSGNTHFINVTGLDKNGNLQVADTYDYKEKRNYSLKDIQGLFVIYKDEE